MALFLVIPLFMHSLWRPGDFSDRLGLQFRWCLSSASG